MSEDDVPDYYNLLSCCRYSFASPAVTDRDADSVYFAGDDGKVTALSQSKGTLKWAYDTGEWWCHEASVRHLVAREARAVP
jgi:hypothetical protein